MHRYAVSRTPPPVDAFQNIANHTATQVQRNGSIFTIVSFTRPVVSADQQDSSLNQDVYILYAWGQENNFDGSNSSSIAQHGSTNQGISTEPISILCSSMASTTTNIRHNTYIVCLRIIDPSKHSVLRIVGNTCSNVGCHVIHS